MLSLTEICQHGYHFLCTCLVCFYTTGYPIRVKKKIAEVENECTRCEEKTGILKMEMKNFIRYYRNNVIRRLKEEVKLLPQLNNVELHYT